MRIEGVLIVNHETFQVLDLEGLFGLLYRFFDLTHNFGMQHLPGVKWRNDARLVSLVDAMTAFGT